MLPSAFVSLVSIAVLVYFYMEEQNQVMRLRMEIPKKLEELTKVREEELALRYEIDQLLAPERLIRLSCLYPHLYSPKVDQVIVVHSSKDPLHTTEAQ